MSAGGQGNQTTCWGGLSCLNDTSFERGTAAMVIERGSVAGQSTEGTAMNDPEVWLRGPLPAYSPLLQPVAHALLQAREDIERLVRTVPADHVWERPGGAASLGFHVVHAAGAIDRLTTYARGERLSEAQIRALGDESSLERAARPFAEVAALALAAIDRALVQVRDTPTEALLEVRTVGRAALPSTVIGLLVHVAEHTTRHVGQAITTAAILRGEPR